MTRPALAVWACCLVSTVAVLASPPGCGNVSGAVPALPPPGAPTVAPTGLMRVYTTRDGETCIYQIELLYADGRHDSSSLTLDVVIDGLETFTKTSQGLADGGIRIPCKSGRRGVTLLYRDKIRATGFLDPGGGSGANGGSGGGGSGGGGSGGGGSGGGGSGGGGSGGGGSGGGPAEPPPPWMSPCSITWPWPATSGDVAGLSGFCRCLYDYWQRKRSGNTIIIVAQSDGGPDDDKWAQRRAEKVRWHFQGLMNSRKLKLKVNLKTQVERHPRKLGPVVGGLVP